MRYTLDTTFHRYEKFSLVWSSKQNAAVIKNFVNSLKIDEKPSLTIGKASDEVIEAVNESRC